MGLIASIILGLLALIIVNTILYALCRKWRWVKMGFTVDCRHSFIFCMGQMVACASDLPIYFRNSVVHNRNKGQAWTRNPLQQLRL